jgi:hypothetical protein
MFKDKNPTARTLPQSIRNEDAVFMGWQKTGSGEAFALYNITAAGHPSLGSTVTGEGLRKLDLQIPRTPFPQ